MTEFLSRNEGTLAFEVSGTGPLVVLAHGMGDSRAAYRFVAPALVAAGYRVASLDLRGCGESSIGWAAYDRTAIASDLIALVRHLGGPAVLVGHSISGGAATIAAAAAPDLVTGLIELAPFTRRQSIRLGDFRTARYRRGTTHLLGTVVLGTVVLGSIRQWVKYLEVAYPGPKPADWDAQLAHIAALLERPGRMAVLRKMGSTPPVDAGEQLPKVDCPVLVVEGTLDPDWASPRAEGEAIVDALPAGLGELTMIEGAGHYPHAQYPAETLAGVLPFLTAVSADDDGARA